MKPGTKTTIKTISAGALLTLACVLGITNLHNGLRHRRGRSVVLFL